MEQEIGNGWAEGVHADDLRQCLDIYASAFERREPFVMEYRLRHRSGGYRWVLDRGAPVYNTGGSFLGYIGGCIDIHDRKLAEEALQTSREELRTLAGRLQAAREEERTELAREIHDELSGTLTALKMDLSLLPDRAAKDRNLFLDKLSSMSALIDGALARVQSIVTGLRPVVLDKFGLLAAIEWQTAEFQDLSGIACKTHLPTEELPLDPVRSTAMFRILQEALTNVARHAHATKVIVDLRSDVGSLILTVRDNGKGIDEKAIYSHQSIGLLGMRERALSFRGTVEITVPSDGGTLVSARIPAG
jgi:signal transduction histidine kinase